MNGTNRDPKGSVIVVGSWRRQMSIPRETVSVDKIAEERMLTSVPFWYCPCQ